ncbi:MAG: BrnT family toxin [bacterium]|nr:BrnT family toxin [bacterium]
MVKHLVSFSQAPYAFLNPHRIILEDANHSTEEERFYCIGLVDDGIMTVCFTYRNNTIRIYDTGYWRKGRKIRNQRARFYSPQMLFSWVR